MQAIPCGYILLQNSDLCPAVSTTFISGMVADGVMFWNTLSCCDTTHTHSVCVRACVMYVCVFVCV